MIVGRRMKEVLVEWVDSTIWGQKWLCYDEAQAMTLNNCRARGWVVKKDKDKIVLAQSMCVEDNSVINLLAIPRGCIKKITEVK